MGVVIQLCDNTEDSFFTQKPSPDLFQIRTLLNHACAGIIITTVQGN